MFEGQALIVLPEKEIVQEFPVNNLTMPVNVVVVWAKISLIHISDYLIRLFVLDMEMFQTTFHFPVLIPVVFL